MTVPSHLGRARPLFAAAVAATAAAVASPPGRRQRCHGTPAARRAGRRRSVQTDNLAGNQIVAYDRSGNGTLTLAGTYATGGLGGQLTGSAVDHLASQGSLAYDATRTLYAVNAGSNTVSVFAVQR